jgi:hypothetical protein
MDGETEFVLGSNDQVHMEGPAAFEGLLRTPGHKIALKTAEGDIVLEMPTAGSETVVRIWINRSWSPDKVYVAVG